MQYSRLSLMLFLALLCNAAIAQISISGIINDEKTGEALPYVTVWLVSENRYSRADENGIFKTYSLKHELLHVQQVKQYSSQYEYDPAKFNLESEYAVYYNRYHDAVAAGGALQASKCSSIMTSLMLRGAEGTFSSGLEP